MRPLLLLWGLAAAAAPGSGAGEETAPCLEIVAVPRSGTGPLRVCFHAKVTRLAEPIRYRWNFGDGQESSEAAPKPHRYVFGKYNVVLEVTDEKGSLCTASVSIDAAPPG